MNIKGKELIWGKGNTFKKLILKLNDKKIGQWERQNIIKSSGLGEINNENITLTSEGLINLSFTIENQKTQKTGKIDLKWIGSDNGKITFEKDRKYTYKNVDIFRGQFSWFDEDKNEIISFKPSNLLFNQGKIGISEKIKNQSDINSLIISGLHFLVLINFWYIATILAIIITLTR